MGFHQAFLPLGRMNDSSATHCLTAKVAKARPQEVAQRWHCLRSLQQGGSQRLCAESMESKLLPDSVGAVLVLSATAWCPPQ